MERGMDESPEGAAEHARPDEDADEREQAEDVDDLDRDPAYNPEDPGLKGVKGG
jgi:hypothetical protein